MKTRFFLGALAIVAVAAFGSPVFAQFDGGYGFNVGGFLDENGDGFNDLAPDADGDGIPNGVDPDYAPPMDGTGYRLNADTGCGDDGFMYRENLRWKHRTVSAGFGPGDGTGYGRGNGPADGTGYGPGDTCVPALDGSGGGNRN